MKKKTYFGTDGIRGQANQYPMTAEVALRVGLAAGKLFRSADDRRHLVVIGKDTRLSGYMIEPALVAGFTSVGMDVRLFGPLPTPAVAMMTRSMRADLGVMISASHNNFADNGIKLFGPDGYKLSDEMEARIEAHMDEGLQEGLASPKQLGRVARMDEAQARYIEIVKATLPRSLALNGLRVVIGKDTRLSGYMIEPALVAGFTSVGMDVRLFGPLPTPAVAMMTRSMRADLGVMISASHNNFADNGIKLFGPDGYKLSDEMEARIEAHMDEGLQEGLA
ncbi:MAG TPA: phosphoglucosamine mutase, partial [Caulobacteraceae bacterium]